MVWIRNQSQNNYYWVCHQDGTFIFAVACKNSLIPFLACRFAGFVTIRLNKVVGLAVGSGIILLEIANENGYVTVNWNKINKKIDKVTDKLEETVTGQGPSLMDKVSK